MKQHQKVTLVLCLIWAITLLFGEMFVYWIPSLWSCSWPHQLKMKELDYAGDYMKVAVIADPQLMDRTSLHLAPKSLALEIAEFYTDLNMRRSFSASIMPFKPDVILFLGDYFDGGHHLSDEEWQESLTRFKHIFDLDTRERSTNIPVYYIDGNHDIGYSRILSRMPEVIERYEKEFGVRNYRFTVGNVEFIAVDAQTLDGNPEGNLTTATWDFIKNVSTDVQYPRILVTHIPLYRSDETYCGPHRSSPSINQGLWRVQDQEIMYQNYISKGSSDKLLELLKPVLVLSGHDHDQCTVTHESKIGPVKEQTLGTISWQMGNLYPSFMLLSVNKSAETSDPEHTVFTQVCFLPMQTHIYLWYLSQFVLTLLVLFFWPKKGIPFSRIFSGLKEITRKEKDEDESCEYEMIWDAEGSMHLVKKALEAPIMRPSERNSVERGNAVMRPTARKTTGDGAEVHMDVDMNSDASAKLTSRNSKMKKIIYRVIRSLCMLIFIATLNIPLYMMLLAKDWIDR